MEKFLGVILAAGKGSRMKSDLPKVLHKVNDKPMVTYCVEALENAGAEKIVVVVGYKKEMIQEELGDRVEYAVQTEQLGTGHAVLSAKDYLKEYNGKVAIVYGDNPLLKPETIKKMVDKVEGDCVGSLLTIELEHPPQAGRIIKDDNGRLVEIIEEQDCTEEQKKIKEINCGTYCFKSDHLLNSLKELKPENNQGEYYLTDVPGILAKKEHSVELVYAKDIFEILGINDQHHREFAEMASEISYAERAIKLADLLNRRSS